MPHIRRRLALLIAAAGLALPGCAYVGPSPADVETELTFCVKEVNRYRALLGMAALARASDLDAYATDSATIDAKAGEPHQHFSTGNGGGVARAETELLGWRNGSIHTVIEQGLSLMWQEGPGGEHYQIIVGPYTEIGCGLFVGAGGVTVAQDYR
jgi:uncharacterized protein YkwD